MGRRWITRKGNYILKNDIISALPISVIKKQHIEEKLSLFGCLGNLIAFLLLLRDLHLFPLRATIKICIYLIIYSYGANLLNSWCSDISNIVEHDTIFLYKSQQCYKIQVLQVASDSIS